LSVYTRLFYQAKLIRLFNFSDHIFLATCRDGEVRLVVSDDADSFYMGSTNYDSSYYDKNGLRVGRVEICVGGNGLLGQQ